MGLYLCHVNGWLLGWSDWKATVVGLCSVLLCIGIRAAGYQFEACLNRASIYEISICVTLPRLRRFGYVVAGFNF